MGRGGVESQLWRCTSLVGGYVLEVYIYLLDTTKVNNTSQCIGEERMGGQRGLWTGQEEGGTRGDERGWNRKGRRGEGSER